MKLTIVFAGSVPKDDAPDYANEDSFACDAAAQRFCMSDGAGQSYAPALWADMLTRAWVQQTGVVATAKGMEGVIERFNQECGAENLSWSRAAAFERGTFATLLGLRLRENRLRVLALGDSLMVITSPEGNVATFPYDDAEAFDTAPQLLSTLPAANRVFTPRTLRDRARVWKITRNTQVLLMTDALGCWLLKHQADEPSRARLADIRTGEALAEFVHTERSRGTLKTDDTTLVHLITEAS
ncbi:MAG: protein phosphatase 2C domain-containing protein [Planctomycetota bacterium]|nr:protein phosphatase 2C domain-containing protein [Planctomycetota bacterium]